MKTWTKFGLLIKIRQIMLSIYKYFNQYENKLMQWSVFHSFNMLKVINNSMFMLEFLVWKNELIAMLG